MADTVTISGLDALTIAQATNDDVLPITNGSDNTTYKISLGTIDSFIKTSPSSSKFISGACDTSVTSTSSISSSLC